MRNIRSVLVGAAVVGAAAAGVTTIADAATSSNSSSTAAPTPAGQRAPANMPAPGTATHEDAEKTVTGASAAKAQAAAVKSVGGGTAGAVTTDFTARGYEVTVTRSGASKVEVHLDGSFNAMPHPGTPGAMPPGGQGMPPGPPGA